MKFLSTGILLLLLNIAQAQRVSAKISNPDKKIFPSGKLIRSGNFLVGFDGVFDDSEMRVPERHGKLTKIDAVFFDTSMRRLQTTPIQEPVNNILLFKDIQVLNNTPYIIYHEITAQNYVGNIMAVPLNPVTQTVGEPLLIGVVENSSYRLTFNSLDHINAGHYLTSSQNGKRHLLFLQHGGSHCFITVLDENMKIMWSKAEVFGANEKATIKSASVDNAGNVYITFVADKKNERRSGTNIRLAIVNENARETDRIIDMPDAGWMSPRLVASQSNADIIHIVGTYLNEGGATSAGLFKMEYSIGGKAISRVKRFPFTDSLIGQLNTAGWIKAKKSGKNYGIGKFFEAGYYQQANGDITAVSEMRMTNTQRSGIMDRTIYQTFGPVISVSLTGEKGYFNFIPRNQSRMPVLEGAKSLPFAMNNGAVIFYNDRAVQQTANGNTNEKFTLIVAIIDAKGIMHREVVDPGDGSYISLPTQSIRLSNTRWIVPMVKVDASGKADGLERWVEVEVKE